MSPLCVKDGFRADLLARFSGLVKCYVVPVINEYFMAIYIRLEDPQRRIISCSLYRDVIHRGSFYPQGTKTWQWVGMNGDIDPAVQRLAAKSLQELVGVGAHIKFNIVNANRTITKQSD